MSGRWILAIAAAVLLLGILGQWSGILPRALNPVFTSLGGANR